MPSLYHTGTPRHFHSSTTPGTACRISERICASVSPRQSPSSRIRASIRAEGVSPVASAPVLLLFMRVTLLWDFCHAGRCRMWPVSARRGAAAGDGRNHRVVEGIHRDCADPSPAYPRARPAALPAQTTDARRRTKAKHVMRPVRALPLIGLLAALVAPTPGLARAPSSRSSGAAAPAAIVQG